MPSTKLFFSAGLLALAASPALAAIDWSSPQYDILVLPGDITPVTGASVANLGTLDVDSNGDIIFFDSGDGTGATGSLLKADVSGASPVITRIIGEPALLGAANPASTVINANGLHVIPGTGSGEEYILTSFNGSIDDVLRVTPGSPATAALLAGTDGINGLAADGNTLFVAVEAAFGAAEDAVIQVDLAGATSTYVSSANIFAVTGGSGEINGISTTAGGDVIFFSEGFFGGSDSILSASAPGVVSEIIPASEPPSTMGLNEIAISPDGVFFLWDQFPGSGGARLLVREPGGVYTTILQTEIRAALSLPANMGVAAGSMAVHVPDASTVDLLIADNANDEILRLRFTDPSSVTDWSVLD
jgi:hypothetical protein